MEFRPVGVKIRDLVAGYLDKDEDGVVGYHGMLNIRPAYQREFVYDDKKKKAVIESVLKGFPLNVMYWIKNADGTYELLDGQQRTLSICQFVDGKYSLDNRYFHSLTQHEKEQILDYDLMIYVCEGNDREKLDWYKTININAESLTDQELRNAVYTGPWLSDAKRFFSRTNCVAFRLAKDYVKGVPIRQQFLEVALDWISEGHIEEYMSKHQKDFDAGELCEYFKSVIEWVKKTFIAYRSVMKGVDWGRFYNKYKDIEICAPTLDAKIDILMLDDEVTNKKGIYEYVFTKDERCLSLRAFTDAQKLECYERQKGICPYCKNEGKEKTYYEFNEMAGDHIIPWSRGGKTVVENCQMLCRLHNNIKGNK